MFSSTLVQETRNILEGVIIVASLGNVSRE